MGDKSVWIWIYQRGRNHHEVLVCFFSSRAKEEFRGCIIICQGAHHQANDKQ